MSIGDTRSSDYCLQSYSDSKPGVGRGFKHFTVHSNMYRHFRELVIQIVVLQHFIKQMFSFGHKKNLKFHRYQRPITQGELPTPSLNYTFDKSKQKVHPKTLGEVYFLKIGCLM